MQKADKERVIEELTERLRSADALLVADYRGLTNSQLAGLRVELLKHGAKLTVVKNTLTRRAAEAAGADALLAMLEGPTAIAFVEADGNPVAVAKALSDAAKDTKILALRGGVLSGNPITGDGDREPREAAAARGPAGSARRGDRCPADPARCGAERAVAEPGRPDRRPDHAARRGRRHVGAAATRGGGSRRPGRPRRRSPRRSAEEAPAEEAAAEEAAAEEAAAEAEPDETVAEATEETPEA